MSGLKITLTRAGYAALVNAENTGTDAVQVSHIGLSNQAFTPDPEYTSVPGELKRLTTFSGSAVADDTVHVTIRDDGPDSYSVRGFGLYLHDGTLLAVYGQEQIILEKSAQAMLLLAADIRFTDVAATVLEFGDTSWANPPATTETAGVLELATQAEALAGIDAQRAMTPATHKTAVDARFGAGAPSSFVKGLLSAATAAAIRVALELGSAAQKEEGAGKGLDADKLDGQHGSYYQAWANLTSVPAAFPPSLHSHAWGDLTGVPATASRWPSWSEVAGKPSAFAPSPHSHAWGDLSGVPVPATRWPAWGEVSGKPSAFNPAAHTHPWGDLSGVPARLNEWLGVSPTDPVFGNAIRITTSGSINYIQSGVGRVNGTFGELRFGNYASSIWQFRIGDGFVEAPGDLRVGGHITAGGNRVYAGTTGDLWLLGGGSHGIGLRPQGWSTVGQFYVRNNGDASVSGAISATGGFDFGSSIKLKHIEGKLPYGLAEVERMQTAIGRYREEYNADGRRRLFFVAEQLAELIPEAVDLEGVEFNDERVASVKLEQILPVFANAIAELSAEVKLLRALLPAAALGVR